MLNTDYKIEAIKELLNEDCIVELYNYIADVDASTTQILKSLTYSDIKEKISDERKQQLENLNVVSNDENAYIMKYAEDNGYKVAGLARECYIDGIWNKESVEDWLTEIQLPIEGGL